MTADMSDLELVEGRLEGLKILLNIPANERTMTDAELRFAIREVETIRDCMKITAEQPEVIEIREVSDEQAEKEILDYYRTYCDASHYPDVVACDLHLDLKQTMRICDKLIKEDKIEVKKDSMKAGVREP